MKFRDLTSADKENITGSPADTHEELQEAPEQC